MWGQMCVAMICVGMICGRDLSHMDTDTAVRVGVRYIAKEYRHIGLASSSVKRTTLSLTFLSGS